MKFDISKFKYEFKDFIGIYENAFTDKECKDVINHFEDYHKCGYTYGRSFLTQNDDLSLDLDIGLHFINSFHERFYNYIYPIYNIQYPTLQNLRKHGPKYIKIQKTLPTQGYHIWHCEHDASDYGKDRVLSWILYLNDVEEGGETEFLYQSLRFKPKTGTFVIFPAHFTHTHRGNPPLSGVKYIATGWIEFLYTSEPQGISEFPDLNKKIINNSYY